MSHISTIGAALFSDLAIATGTITGATVGNPAPGTRDATGFAALFATTASGAGGFTRFSNVREFPAVGTPANIVNVPSYGSKTSSTIQAQADAPSLEVTVNYVASEWASGATGTALGNAALDGLERAFRFTLLNVEPTGATAATKYASLPAGLGQVANSEFYWMGKIEAVLVTPSLSDTTTATITLSITSPFYGAYTLAST